MDSNIEWTMYSKRYCKFRDSYWQGVREMIQEELAGVVPCDIRNLGVE